MGREAEDEEEVGFGVAAGEPARLHRKTEEPLAAEALDPARRLADATAVKIEGGADADEEAGVEGCGVRGHEAFLLRRAQSDPKDIGAGAGDIGLQRGEFVGVERTERRRERAGDREAGEASGEFFGQRGGDAGGAAVEVVAEAEGAAGVADGEEQVGAVDALDPGRTKPHERHAVGRAEIGAVENIAEGGIGVGFAETVDVADADVAEVALATGSEEEVARAAERERGETDAEDVVARRQSDGGRKRGGRDDVHPARASGGGRRAANDFGKAGSRAKRECAGNRNSRGGEACARRGRRSACAVRMALVNLLDVSLSFGGPPLLDHVNLQIDPGERVCLVGRNGAGKSTLMKVIAGELRPDEGQVFRQAGAGFSMLRQEVPAGLAGTVRSVVEGEGGSYEEHNDWERHDRVERLLEQMGLPAESEFATLSAGQKRRVLLARGLVEAPQLLLLDEPTNHLDLESIQWLEEFLLSWGGALLFVTHDRAFLRRLATRIVEVDRGKLVGWACDYDTFLVRKQAVLEAEEVQRAQFDKKLAQEEEWIRRGVKAQRSRAQNRIHALEKMRAERAARRERTGTAKLTAQEADRSGFKVIACDGAGFRYGGADGRWIVRGLTTRIERGDKVGIVGPNGAGKTTLLKLLLGELAPTEGTIEQGTRLEVVYFDQLRAQLNEEMRVQDAVADGNATVTINGRTRHVISYLEDFLFEPARARTPIRALSGGERNRLLLARLFTKPCNVLVLDEPTNDLDAETLELLEDLLVEFGGTLLLVSHDRAFLNEVCTSLLVFEGDGRVSDYLGGYDDWQRERAAKAARAAAADEAAKRAAKAAAAGAPAVSVEKKARKLTNKERAELEALPKRIEVLEAEQAELTARLGDPEFFKKAGAEVATATARLAELEAEVAAAYARWSELEG